MEGAGVEPAHFWHNSEMEMNELNELEAQSSATNEDWEFAYSCYPNLQQMSHAELMQALVNELADVRMLSKHCSTIYDHCTNSRISKPNTLPSEVIAVMEEFWRWREDDEPVTKNNF